jgi:hypothetical protein
MMARKVTHQLAVSQRLLERLLASHGLSALVSFDLSLVVGRGFFCGRGKASTDADEEAGMTGGGDQMEEGREAGERKGERKMVVALLTRGGGSAVLVRWRFAREMEPLNDL